MNTFIIHGSAIDEEGRISTVQLKVGGGVVAGPFQGFPRCDLASSDSFGSPAATLYSGFAVAWSGRLDPGLVQVAIRFGVGHATSRSGFSAWIEVGYLRVEAPKLKLRTGPPAEVAIAMATYNPSPRLFAAQLNSIRAQTLTNWSLTISDESTDRESILIVAKCAEGDPKINVIRGSRIGVCGNFERALKALDRRSPYFALSDQDDAWKPDKLAIMTKSLAHSKKSLAYCDLCVVSESEELLEPSFYKWRKSIQLNTEELVFSNIVPGAAIVGKMHILPTALPIPRYSKTYHDSWIAAVASCISGIEFVDRVLQYYVQHRNNIVGHSSKVDRSVSRLLAEQTLHINTFFEKPHSINAEAAFRLLPVISTMLAAAIEREFIFSALSARTSLSQDTEDPFRIDLSAVGMARKFELRESMLGTDKNSRRFLNIPSWINAGLRAFKIIMGNVALSSTIADMSRK